LTVDRLVRREKHPKRSAQLHALLSMTHAHMLMIFCSRVQSIAITLTDKRYLNK